MKTHTTNYHNTFIAVAEDTTTKAGTLPPDNGKKKTIANLQFEMIHQNPYGYTSDEVLFQCFATKHEITEEGWEQAQTLFFSKGQACMRCSPLTKTYGWGLHCNEEGKIALYGVESIEYKEFIKNEGLKVIKAMRSKRK